MSIFRDNLRIVVDDLPYRPGRLDDEELTEVFGGAMHLVIMGNIASSVTNTENGLRQTIQTMNKSNPNDLLKFNMTMQKWSMAINLQSNTVKQMGEALKSIAANIR